MWINESVVCGVPCWLNTPCTRGLALKQGWCQRCSSHKVYYRIYALLKCIRRSIYKRVCSNSVVHVTFIRTCVPKKLASPGLRRCCPTRRSEPRLLSCWSLPSVAWTRRHHRAWPSVLLLSASTTLKIWLFEIKWHRLHCVKSIIVILRSMYI